MSLLFCSSYQSMLRPDIKDDIRTKIEEHQNDYDWCLFDDCIDDNDMDLSTLNYKDIVYQRELWENIAKLSMDFWRDYDHYQNFVFESRFDDKNYFDRLISLDFVLKDDRWTSIAKPSEDVVLTHLFVYGLYRSLTNQMARNADPLDRVESISCFYCGNVILPLNDNCDACGASVEEINELYQINDEKKNQELLMRSCNKDMSEGNGEAVVIRSLNDIRIVERGSDEECGVRSDIVAKSEGGIDEDDRHNSTKWKCRKCGILNESSSIDCKEYQRLCTVVKRTCGDCNTNSDCIDVICHCCGQLSGCAVFDADPGENREHVIGRFEMKQSPPMSDLSSREPTERWTCEVCGCFNSYSMSNCVACGQLSDHGSWSCKRCRSVNSCKDERCQNCRIQFADVKLKYSVEIHPRKMKENERKFKDLTKSRPQKPFSNKNRWQCQNSICRKFNNDDDGFCHACKLERNFSRKVGAEIKKKSRTGVSSVWICLKCNRFNETPQWTCSAPFCCGQRYDLVSCPSCLSTSDKRRRNCKQCDFKF